MISPIRSLIDLVLLVALGLADLLNQHLLRGLRRNAAIVERRQRFGDPVADLSRRVLLLRVGERDLGRVVLDLIDDQQQPRKADFAGLRIDLRADLGLLTVARARRLLHRVLHRGEYDRTVDRFLARDGVDDLQEFESVGANGHRSLLREARAALGAAPRAAALRFELVLSLAGFRRGGAPGARAAGRRASFSAAFSRLRAARMRSSVSTSRASPMARIGSSTRVSLLSSAVTRRRAAGPSGPCATASIRPRKRLRPSTAVAISIRASHPTARSKSDCRTSGRSMPGEESSSR